MNYTKGFLHCIVFSPNNFCPAVFQHFSSYVWVIMMLFSLKLQELRNMIPFENMTYEDLPEKFRDPTLDPVKYPHWPHKLASDVS